MKKLVFSIALISIVSAAVAQQVPNADFEDWSAPAFKNCPQPKGWNASNVEQFGLKFNFAHREAGHTGNCLMVQDQSIGAMGVKETSPGYFSLGQPWVFIENLFKVKYATAGTYGGIKWTHLPDTMSVWIRRTGDNTDKEDFYLLYYSWAGEAKGTGYKNKNGTCTEVTYVNEESDIRQALNGNECCTAQKATQVAEGMWREKKTYKNWTNIRVPIYYMSSKAPTMMNLIFSASNYPNFRANSGLYAGNSLYVDDIEFIYAATVQKITIDGKTWTDWDGKTDLVTTEPSVTQSFGAGVHSISVCVSNDVATFGAKYAFAEPFEVLAQPVRYVKAGNPDAAEPYDTEANAAGDIQMAINFCGEEEKIVVLKGIYNTTEAVNVNKKLEVVGATGNPEDVIIHNTVSGYRCLKVTKAGAFVASMALENGSPDWEHDHTSSFKGTGAYVTAGTVSNLVVRSCTSKYDSLASGAAITADGASTFITHCVITNNTASG